MSWSDRFVPPFLHRFDNYLLTRCPWLWSTRFHYHLWYLLLVDVALVCMALLWPVHTHDIPNNDLFWYYLAIPQLVYAAFWIYQQVLFNVPRSFGQWKWWFGIPDYFIRMLCLWSIATISFFPAYTLQWRIANVVTDAEYVADRNQLAQGYRYFVGTPGDYEYFKNDSTYLTRDWDDPELADYERIEPLHVKQEMLATVVQIWSVQRQRHLDSLFGEPDLDVAATKADSLRWSAKVAEATFKLDSIASKHKRYLVDLNEDSVWFDSSLTMWGEWHLERQFIECREWTNTQHLDVIAATKTTYAKYGVPVTQHADSVLTNFKALLSAPEYELSDMSLTWFNDSAIIDMAERHYDIMAGSYEWEGYRYHSWDTPQTYANHSLGPISIAKFQRADFNNYLIWGYLLIAYGCCSVLLAFRGVRWQWFLGACLGAVVIFALLSSAVGLADRVFREAFLIHSCLLLTGVVAVLVVRGLLLKRRSHLGNAAAVLLVVVSVGILVLATAYFDFTFDIFDRDRYDAAWAELYDKSDAGLMTEQAIEAEKTRLRKLKSDLRAAIELKYYAVAGVNILLYLLVLAPTFQVMLNRLESYPKKK